MRRIQFHIGTLVIAVLILGVSFAALRESNEMWDGAILSLASAALLTSVLLAIHRSEKSRAFWLGFALFGTLYLGASLIPSIESRLITSKALDYLDSRVPRSVSLAVGVSYADYDSDGKLDVVLANNSQPTVHYLNRGDGSFQEVTTAVGLNSQGNQGTGNDGFAFFNSARMWVVGTTENFIRIGHSLIALVAACAGGLLSRRLYDRNRHPAHGSTSPAGSISDGARK
jgi:hypothetical protein